MSTRDHVEAYGKAIHEADLQQWDAYDAAETFEERRDAHQAHTAAYAEATEEFYAAWQGAWDAEAEARWGPVVPVSAYSEPLTMSA